MLSPLHPSPPSPVDSLDIFSFFVFKVVKYLVKPSTEYEGRCRFARHPVAISFTGRADAMMSHYWDGSWGDLIAAAAQGANMGRFIWICALANRCVLYIRQRERERQE